MTVLQNLYRMPGFWVVAITVVVFANSLPNGLTFDDHVIVEANPNVEQVDLGSIFRSPYWPDRQGAGLYRPLTTLSLAIQYAIHGVDPFGYHLVNVVFHAANVLLVYLLARHLLSSVFLASGVALVFGLHPVQTEAVNGIVGRAELLSGFWFLTAWFFYIRSGVGQGGRLNRVYGLSLLAALLGMLSKENSVCLVGVLVVYDWIWQHRGRWPGGLGGYLKAGLPRYMPFLFLIGAFLFVRSQAVGAVFLPALPGEAENILPHLVGATRWFTTLAATGVYFYLLIYPMRLMPDYSYVEIPVVGSLFDPMAWVPLAIIIGFSVLVVMWIIRQNFMVGVLGILVFVVAFSPVSNFLVTIGTILGERLLYLPMVGFAIFVGAGFEYVLGMVQEKRYVYAVLAVVLGFYGARTVMRNGDWRNDVTLFSTAIGDGNRSAKVYYNLGVGYRKQKRYDEAIAAFERVVEHKPGHPESWKYLGIVYAEKGHHTKAADMYEVAVKLDSTQVDLWKRLGSEREALKDWDRAERMYERALKLADDIELHFLVARMCYQRNRFDCVIRHCLFVLDADVQHRDAAVLLARAYLKVGQSVEARALLEVIKTRWPDAPEIRVLIQRLSTQ